LLRGWGEVGLILLWLVCFFWGGGGGAILRIRLKIENAGDGNTCSQLQAELYIKLNRYSEVV